MKEIIILILLFVTLGYNFSFARAPAGEIERAEEILEKERILRKRLKKAKKFFIRKIVVEGVSLLEPEEIESIILPFQKHWLTEKEILKITDLIIQAYEEKEYWEVGVEISYQVKGDTLFIQIKEKTKTEKEIELKNSHKKDKVSGRR